MKLTKELLREYDACDDGYNWFVKNFPKGLIINKPNIQLLVNKLLRRKKTFQGLSQNIKEDTVYTLEWLLNMIFTNYNYFCRNRNIGESIEVANAWSEEEIVNEFMKRFKSKE